MQLQRIGFRKRSCLPLSISANPTYANALTLLSCKEETRTNLLIAVRKQRIHCRLATSKGK